MDDRTRALIENGKDTRFPPGKSGNPKGRPPSWLKKAKEEYALSRSDASAVFNSLLFHTPVIDLAKICENAKNGKRGMPSFMAACARGILSDVKKGDMRATALMLERMHGRPHAEVTVNDGGMTDLEKKEFLLYRIYKRLHPGQQAIWNDPAKQKMICMPRRWGKSFFVFSRMVADCIGEPHSRCLYVGRSIKEAEKQISEMRLDWLYRMGMPPDTDLRDIFPEGSWIDTFGLTPGADGNGIRGRKYKRVIYDEFFHLREDYLEYFMEQVIAPMQRDYADWSEIRVGTVPEADFTYGGQAWQDALLGRSGWKAYTTHDPDENPNISPFEPWFKEKYPGRDISEPWVQREFFCKWVFDTETRVFPEWHTYSAKGGPPNMPITHILFGIDFGHNHDSAVIGTAWNLNEGAGYVFFEEAFNYATTRGSMGVQEYLDEVCGRGYEKAIDLIGIGNLGKIIWRADSANPADIQRLRKNVKAEQAAHSRKPINIVPAYKQQAEFMHGEMKVLFRSGKLLVPAGGRLEKEMRQTIYRRDEATGLVTNDLDERFHPNLIPALRYSLEFVLMKGMGINVNQLAKGRR